MFMEGLIENSLKDAYKNYNAIHYIYLETAKRRFKSKSVNPKKIGFYSQKAIQHFFEKHHGTQNMFLSERALNADLGDLKHIYYQYAALKAAEYAKKQSGDFRANLARSINAVSKDRDVPEPEMLKILAPMLEREFFAA